MFKKFLFLVLACALVKIIFAEDVQPHNSLVELTAIDIAETQSAIAVKDFISFDVKKSTEFQRCVELLSAESKVALEDFIKKTKQALSDNIELAEIIKQYKGLFDKLKVVKKNTKVVLFFSLDEEHWTTLLEIEELNDGALKNAFFEDQVTKFSEDFSAIAASLENIGKSTLIDLHNSSFQRELKEKSGNKAFRSGLILA